MEQAILTLMFSLMSVCSFAQMTFCKTFTYDERVHDFGVINEKDGSVMHTFTFTNNGKKPVAITEVSGWCGCTKASFSKHPIRPKEKAKVTVTFNPYGRPGKFSKEVHVILNGGKEYVRLWLKGTVKGYNHPITEDYPYALSKELYVGFNLVPFGFRSSGARTVVTERIANNTRKTMEIKFLRVPDNRILKMPDRIILKPFQRMTFNISYVAPKVYHYDRQILVYPVVNGIKVKPITIKLLGKKA